MRMKFFENKLVEDEVISETNAEQPEIVAENPILETFEAIEEQLRTSIKMMKYLMKASKNN
jgi:hypothetical protein